MTNLFNLSLYYNNYMRTVNMYYNFIKRWVCACGMRVSAAASAATWNTTTFSK